MHDALVIGAGHNGLVCAAYLAKAGLDVPLVEKADRLGGACITQELYPGFHFSTFAYNAHGPGPKICLDLEIPPETFEVAIQDPCLVQLFPDSDRVVLWRDRAQTEQELSRFGTAEPHRYQRFVDFSHKALRICSEFFFTDPPDPLQLRAKWNHPRDAEVLDILLGGSLWDVICSCFSHPKVRLAFSRADDSGPSNHPGSALAEFVESASTGLGVQNQPGLLEEGMDHITQVLAPRVSAYGGATRLAAPVRNVVVQQGRAQGVERESGEVILSRRVISNADPKRTVLNLVGSEHLNPSFRRSVENLQTRAGNMKFLAALSQPPRFKALSEKEKENPRFAAAVRIVPSLQYMEEAWRDCQLGKLPRNPVLSLQMPTAYWPSQAPAGSQVFGAWLRWASPRFTDGSSWEDHRRQMADRVIEIVEEYAPGLAASVEWCALYTPDDTEKETGITHATISH
jgi:phytoene dehydrogenase-like protein